MPKKATQELLYDVYDLKGKKINQGSIVNSLDNISKYKSLVAQAVRVFLVNQRQGTQSTKSRGEVEGSTRKIYKQKGTGRARHGDIKAPIFVGGGIIFGPKPRDFELKLNKKMRKKAFLISVIDKILNKKFIVIDGLEKLPVKTKEFFNLLKKIFLEDIKKEKILFINRGNENILLSVRNIPFIKPVLVNTANTYEVLTHSVILAEKNIVTDLFKRMGVVIEEPRKKISKSKSKK